MAERRSDSFTRSSESPGMKVSPSAQAAAAARAVAPFHDHRIAMAFAVAGLPVGVRILEPGWAEISYPGFFQDLKRLCGGS